MKPTPFDPAKDYPPIPFDQSVLEAARDLKRAGLPWNPHVGCFVWDPDEVMPVPSPFPQRIYFVLNLGRFTEILGSTEAVREELVWIPTWTQARALLAAYGADNPAVASTATHAAHLIAMYRSIRAAVAAEGAAP